MLEREKSTVVGVLGMLRDNRLCIAPDKYEWAQHRVEFLGYILSGEGIGTTDEVETIKKIDPVASPKEVVCGGVIVQYENTQSLSTFARTYLPFFRRK